MSDTEPSRSRRRFVVAAAGLATAGALAGCVGDIDPEGVPSRPSYGADPSGLDPELRFIVVSVHYQNLYFDNQGDGLPDRPQFTSGSFDQYDRELRFILESLDYQNAYIEAEVG